MFTGIVECIGKIEYVETEGSNKHFTITSSINNALKVDQSVSHDGVCLTVTEARNGWHKVTAIAETLKRTTLDAWETGRQINLERCMLADGRFDGHIVQGHVDCIGTLTEIEDRNGSWGLVFNYAPDDAYITVPKGSICVNGVSLTVVQSDPTRFSVEIIPYTWKHTNLGAIVPGECVNLEFDIIGKYLAVLAFRKKT